MVLERAIMQDPASDTFSGRPRKVSADTSEFGAMEQRAERQRLMGELASDVVHDLNNLLAAVEAISKLIDLNIEDDNLKKLVQRLNRSANVGRSMTRRLLDYAQDEESGVAPVDLALLVESEIELLDHILSRQITLDFETQDSDCLVLVEPTRVRSALYNMVVNARDAIEGGGDITVRQYVKDAEGGCCQVLEVADTGKGMSPEVLAKVGERYYTTKGRGKGSGLGVSSIMALAEDCGGHVDIESTEGKGTVIRLVLPCMDVA